MSYAVVQQHNTTQHNTTSGQCCTHAPELERVIELAHQTARETGVDDIGKEGGVLDLREREVGRERGRGRGREREGGRGGEREREGE